MTDDRRGHSDSERPLGPWHSLDREFVVVATMVDEVAARARSRAALWGYSFGLSRVMGAAAFTANVSHVLLYEAVRSLP